MSMNQKTAEYVTEILKALANPVRLQIVELLETGEKSVGEITKKLGAQQAITSHHLNIMKSKGVLNCRREGPKVFYRIENQSVILLLHCIYDHCER